MTGGSRATRDELFKPVFLGRFVCFCFNVICTVVFRFFGGNGVGCYAARLQDEGEGFCGGGVFIG